MILLQHTTNMQEQSLITWPLSPSAHTSPSLSTNSPSQNFAPTLIMLRIVLKHGRLDNEWSMKVSDLRFNSTPGVQEAARSRGATGMIVTIPKSRNGEGVDVEANVESRTEFSDGLNEIGSSVDETKAKNW
jgi:hypothetical protein